MPRRPARQGPGRPRRCRRVLGTADRAERPSWSLRIGQHRPCQVFKSANVSPTVVFLTAFRDTRRGDFELAAGLYRYVRHTVGKVTSKPLGNCPSLGLAVSAERVTPVQLVPQKRALGWTLFLGWPRFTESAHHGQLRP